MPERSTPVYHKITVSYGDLMSVFFVSKIVPFTV